MMPAAPPRLTRACALFLDVDGCLLEIAPTPDSVIVPADLPPVLAQWHRELGGAIALVSGRSIAQLDALFHPMVLPAAGLHGAELRGARTADPPHPPTALRDILAHARDVAGAWPGAFIEDKGAAIALHWRGAPAAEPAMRAFALAALAQLPGYELQEGKSVIEVRPPGGNKGDAIAAFLAIPPFAGRVPVFLGDDRTDEPGFAVVNAIGGVSAFVGPMRRGATTVAQFWLQSPSAVLQWLSSSLVDAGTTTETTS